MGHGAFLSAFRSVFAETERDVPDVIERYRQSATWTPFMLAEMPAGLLRKVARQWAAACSYDATAISLHAEWYKFDLCLVSPAYDGAGDYWKSRTPLTIEHENDSDVETEMWKLAHWRADLSVLVFHDFSAAECATDQQSGTSGCRA